VIRLLDVNVLVALAWPNHLHHHRALHWFNEIRDAGWATCSITEAGFVRVSSNAKVIPGARSPREAIQLLGEIQRVPGHEFWADDVSLIGPEGGVFDRVVGYRQITDAHLLSLAIRREGVLSTFDRGIPELAGPGAQKMVELIP
jgi:uncharacterized protein